MVKYNIFPHIALLINVRKEFTQFGEWVRTLWDGRIRHSVVGLVVGHIRLDPMHGLGFPAFLLPTAYKEKPVRPYLVSLLLFS